MEHRRSNSGVESVRVGDQKSVEEKTGRLHNFHRQHRCGGECLRQLRSGPRSDTRSAGALVRIQGYLSAEELMSFVCPKGLSIGVHTVSGQQARGASALAPRLRPERKARLLWAGHAGPANGNRDSATQCVVIVSSSVALYKVGQ